MVDVSEMIDMSVRHGTFRTKSLATSTQKKVSVHPDTLLYCEHLLGLIYRLPLQNSTQFVHGVPHIKAHGSDTENLGSTIVEVYKHEARDGRPTCDIEAAVSSRTISVRLPESLPSPATDAGSFVHAV